MREGENNIKNNEGKVSGADGENSTKEGKIINFWDPTADELRFIQETGRMPESLIKRRVSECLAREGLPQRLETSDDEIEEFLQKNGFKIERSIPPRAKLFSYITEKYREDIFKEQAELKK